MNRAERVYQARGYDPAVTNSSLLQVDLDDVEAFTREFLEELQFGQGVALTRASANDLYMALAKTVRQHLMSRWLDTLSTQIGLQAKAVAYLSAEYLLGRQLDNALLATGLTSNYRSDRHVTNHGATARKSLFRGCCESHRVLLFAVLQLV